MEHKSEESTKIDEKGRKAGFVAKFVCYVCGKTFYNYVALQNHKNLHHDLDEVKEKESQPLHLRTIATQFSESSSDPLTDNFVFIPLLQDEEDAGTIVQSAGLPSRFFAEDTSYVVLRLAGDEADIDAAKRRRLEGVLQRTKKPQVVIKLDQC